MSAPPPTAPPLTREWTPGAVLGGRDVDAQTYLLVVRGDAGPGAALDLRRRLLGLRLAGYTTLIVDLNASDRVSDAVRAALMHGRRKIAARAGRLVVASEHPAVRSAIRRVGLEVADGI